MQELFRDIIALPGVRGVMLVTLDGKILLESFQPTVDRPPQSKQWHLFLETLVDVIETDLVFADGRLYVRRVPQGYVLIVSSQFAQSAMVRLHCDILLPELENLKAKKKKRFFKRSV